jgi:hypothetical protein
MKRLTFVAILLLLVFAVAVSARPNTPLSVLKAGTPVDVVLQVSLDTDASEAGDRFSARLAVPILVGGKVVVPAGAFLHGHVVLSDPVARDGHSGRLILAYDQLSFGGHAYGLGVQSGEYHSRQGTDLDAGSSLRFTLDRDVRCAGATGGLGMDGSPPVPSGNTTAPVLERGSGLVVCVPAVGG